MLFLCYFCSLLHVFVFFFFFQAEDGIRDDLVTGVQTCALPICTRPQIRNPRWDRNRRWRAAIRTPPRIFRRHFKIVLTGDSSRKCCEEDAVLPDSWSDNVKKTGRPSTNRTVACHCFGGLLLTWDRRGNLDQ